ncbi:MAG: septum formation initiator family protein [Clostridia bacterium]|nr:septum formation initiator family protein [Clostridia bacterium]
MKIIKKHYKKILIFIAIAYIINIVISQQKMLNSYNSEIKVYEAQINKEKETKESLNNIKDNVNSPEYIEKIARERLDMYLPNEKVYIDIGK